jgi:hypothetical protein
VHPGGGGFGVRDKNGIRGPQDLAQIGFSLHCHLGIAATDRESCFHTANIRNRGGGDKLLRGELCEEGLRQDDEIGWRARAQLVGHQTDRAELTVDAEAGPHLESLGEATYQTLRRAAAQNVHCRHDANSMAAMILSRVIGRSRTRTPRQS